MNEEITIIINECIVGNCFYKNSAQVKLLNAGFDPESILSKIIEELRAKGFIIQE